MGTFLCRLFPLKILPVTFGLTLGLGLPVLSQPVLDSPQPTAAALAPAFQLPKNFEPPRIRPLAIPENPITFNRKFRPSKFVGLLPQFDGDGFAFLIPSRTEATLKSWSAKAVFEQVVSPFLSNIGFKSPGSRFRLFDDSYQGRELPQADLETLAKATCRQWWIQNDTNTRQSCALLTKPSNMTSEGDASFKTRTGMGVGEFKKALERGTVEYFFTQEHEVKKSDHPAVHDVPAKVPLEHAGIRVERRKREESLFVTGRVIDNDLTVTNAISIGPDAVPSAARKALIKIEGIHSVSEKLLSPVELVLLPYGGTGGPESRPQFKYAYRMALVADFIGLKGTFYLWLDADKSEILQLVPTIGSAMATGKTFLRDPGSLSSTGLAEFEIDDMDNPPDGKFMLSLSGIFKRLDRADAGYGDGELEKKASDFTPPLKNSELTSPRFDRDPMGKVVLDPAADPKGIRNLSCERGGNRDFAQVDLMATISRYRTTFNGAGPVLSQFPRTERTIIMDQLGCNAYYGHEGFIFQFCDGYSDADCPDRGSLNSAHDHTVVAHEFGHAFTKYQYGFPEDLDLATKPRGDRLTSWCLGPTLEVGQRPGGTASGPCPKPILPDDIFHDFADAWSQVLEDTNCFGGWWGKNRGGTNFSKDCRYQGADPSPPPGHQPHDEGGGYPRLSEVGMDHFPEHRKAGQQGEYSDMQIASAALWAVRDGLKQRDQAAGAVLYLGRFVQTLGTTGWLGQPTISKTSSGYIDRDIYRYLVELEIKLASRWWNGSSNHGEAMVNKVVSGFARTGIFMIRWACLDGDTATPVGSPCESGADAVIDVEPGADYLTRSGSSPTFHIWTGPLYKFDVNGTASNYSPSSATPSLCNSDFEVEIANDMNFTPGSTRSSTPANGIWKTVSNTSSSGCHATWEPDPSDWNLLKGTSGDTRVYYRVRTRNGGGGDVRISTRPANSLFGDFDPPYLVVSGNLPMDGIPPKPPQGLEVK